MLNLVYKNVATVKRKFWKPLTLQLLRSCLALKFGVCEIIFLDKTTVTASKGLKRILFFVNIST